LKGCFPEVLILAVVEVQHLSTDQSSPAPVIEGNQSSWLFCAYFQ